MSTDVDDKITQTLLRAAATADVDKAAMRSFLITTARPPRRNVVMPFRAVTVAAGALVVASAIALAVLVGSRSSDEPAVPADVSVPVASIDSDGLPRLLPGYLPDGFEITQSLRDPGGTASASPRTVIVGRVGAD